MKCVALLAAIAVAASLPSFAMAQISGQGPYGQRIDNALKTGQMTPAQAAQAIANNAQTLRTLQSMSNHDGLGYDTSAGQQSRIYGAQYNDLMQQAAIPEGVPAPNYSLPAAKPLTAPSNAMVSAPTATPTQPRSGFVKPSATPPE